MAPSPIAITSAPPTETGTDAKSPGGKAFGWKFSTPLIVASALNPINSSIIATALVPIAAALGASVGHVAVLVTVLYIASAVAQPAMGRIGELFGPRKIFIAGAALIAIAGAIGATANDLPTLIVARVLLGVGTSASFPTAMIMIRRRAESTGASPASTLGNLVLASQLTVVLGLPLGGLLVSLAGWRATFWINIPLAFAVLVMAWRWSPHDESQNVRRGGRTVVRELDPAGMLLFASCLVTLVLFLENVAGGRSWALLVASGAAVATLIAWELRSSAPFIDMRSLARNRSLAATYARTAGITLVAYCVMYGLTQWLQEVRSLSATATGLLVVPMSGAGAVVSGYVARRGLVRTPLIVSAATAIAASVSLRFVESSTPLPIIIAITSMVGVAVGLSTVGNQAAVFAQAGPNETGIAAGLLRTSTYIGAIASGTLIGIAFQEAPSDAGLHSISNVLIVVTTLVLALTLINRRLPRRLGSLVAEARPEVTAPA